MLEKSQFIPFCLCDMGMYSHTVFISVSWLPSWLSGKESACSVGDPGWIPGLGRSPGEGNGNPLQHSFLENPMDRGAW